LDIDNTFYPYDVTADGQRFLMATVAETAPSPITVVTNWAADLNR
jgi:hypothetical protein